MSRANQLFSPDGTLVVTTYFDAQEGIKMAIYPIGGGPPLKILDLWSSYFQWAPDGRSIHYINRESVANIISQPVNGAAPKPLTNFTAGGISAFAWSRSGQLAWSTATSAADVVVLNDQVTP